MTEELEAALVEREQAIARLRAVYGFSDQEARDYIDFCEAQWGKAA